MSHYCLPHLHDTLYCHQSNVWARKNQNAHLATESIHSIEYKCFKCKFSRTILVNITHKRFVSHSLAIGEWLKTQKNNEKKFFPICWLECWTKFLFHLSANNNNGRHLHLLYGWHAHCKRYCLSIDGQHKYTVLAWASVIFHANDIRSLLVFMCVK